MKTLDYTKFKPIAGNRPIDKHHVARLVAAMERRNLLKYFPLLVNEDRQVIDGQHRLAAARELGLEVYYEVVPGLVIEDVMSINTHSKSWTVYNFIDAWAKLDKPDYIELKAFIEEFGVSASIAGHLLTGITGNQGKVVRGALRQMSTAGSGSHVTERIRGGTFAINTPKLARKVATFVKQLEPYCDYAVRRHNSFISAIRLLCMMPDFDPERLLAKLRNNELTIGRRISEKYYLLQLEEIYNFNVKNDSNFVELYKAGQLVNVEQAG